MAKKVLVSGGAGYIGSHVTVELIAAGYDVGVADNMSNCDMTCFEGVKKITGRDDIPFYQIDCCDYTSVEALFTEHKIDAVIHFAAFKAVGESVAQPIMYYRNNLVSFLNILEAAKDADVLYTDVWASMGQESEAEERKKIFAGYQINDSLMAVAKPDAMVLHCLPAHREEEITAKVFEEHAKEIFEEAENRLHAQKAVLVKLMKD